MKNTATISKPSTSVELTNVYSCNNIGDAAIYASLAELSGNDTVLWPHETTRSEAVVQTGFPFISNKLPTARRSRISVGGDIFNNARPKFITRRFLQNMRDLGRSAGQTCVFGQSIPRSCHGLSFRLLAWQMSRLASVTVRDTESYNRLNEAGVDVSLSYDAVFAQTIRDEWRDAAIKQLAAEHDFSRMALLSLRPFDAMYGYDTRACIRLMIDTCRGLRQRGFIPTIMLHAAVDQHDGDVQMIREIAREVPVRVIDPFVTSGIAPWKLAAASISMAQIVIGVRYHMSIFRLIAGKVPFNLYYSNKGEDLCVRVSVPGKAIHTFDPEQDLDLAIATQHQSFDAQRIRNAVRADFAAALRRTQAEQSLAANHMSWQWGQR